MDDQYRLAKLFEEWVDQLPCVGVERRQEFSELVDNIRRLTRPMSVHKFTQNGDLDVLRAYAPHTARRIEDELNRLQTLLEMKDV